MHWKTWGLIIVVVFGVGCKTDTFLTARQVTGPITIDGKLDEPDWQQTMLTEPFVAASGAKNSVADDPRYETRVRVLWQADKLYFGFVCKAPQYQAGKTKHDDKLHEEDVAEVFLDVRGDMLHYTEWVVSPKAVTGDVYHTWEQAPSYPASAINWDERKRKGHKMDLAWNPGGFKAATSDVRRDGKLVAWIVEMVIPAAEVLQRADLPPELKRYQLIKANFIRYTRPLNPETGKRVFHHLNWNPTSTGCPHVTPMSMRYIMLK